MRRDGPGSHRGLVPFCFLRVRLKSITSITAPLQTKTIDVPSALKKLTPLRMDENECSNAIVLDATDDAA